MALTKEDLQAIGSLMDERLDVALKPIKADIADIKGDIENIKEDIEVIKEDMKVTQYARNILLKWAEKADRSVNVGLYDDD